MAVNVQNHDTAAPATWATVTLDAGDSVILSLPGPAAVSPARHIAWTYQPAAGGSCAVHLTLAPQPAAGDWVAHGDHGNIAAAAADIEDATFAHMRWTAAAAGGTLRVMTAVDAALAAG